jgi:hypothetical protein
MGSCTFLANDRTSWTKDTGSTFSTSMLIKHHLNITRKPPTRFRPSDLRPAGLRLLGAHRHHRWRHHCHPACALVSRVGSRVAEHAMRVIRTRIERTFA